MEKAKMLLSEGTVRTLEPLRKKKSAWLLFFVSVLLGLTFRLVCIWEKKTIEYDEGISYLTATGHEGEYQATRPGTQDKLLEGRWVSASEWQQFFQPPKEFRFRGISRDLAQHDIHPPLYFWLLHVWSSMVGIGLWTGPALNLLIFVLTAMALFRFSILALEDSLEAALVVFFWSVSPATILISGMARHYELLALASVLFAWQTTKNVSIEEAPRFKDLLLLMVIVAAGVLIQYQFLLVMVPAALALTTVKLYKRDPKSLAMLVTAAFLGCFAAYLLHPNFHNSFALSQRWSDVFDSRDIVSRALVLLASFSGFFTAVLQRISDGGLLYDPTYSTPLGVREILLVLSKDDYATMVVVLIFFVVLGWFLLKGLRDVDFKAEFKSIVSRPAGCALWFGLWVIGSIAAIYMGFLIPKEAIRERHLSMLWPFLSLWMVFILRYSWKRNAMTLSAVLFSACLGISFVIHYAALNSKLGNAGSIFAEAHNVVIDTVEEGKLIPILWHIPGDKPVFAGSPAYMLGNPEQWLQGLEEKTFIVSVLGHGTTRENQQSLVKLAETRCVVKPMGVALWKWTTVFSVGPCHAPKVRMTK